MIDLSYAAAQVGAVWKMAWNRPGWTDELDRSVDGVFRSFSAMILAAPLLAFSFAAGLIAARASPSLASEQVVAAPMSVFVPAQMVGAYADWCLSLTALAFLARSVGASRRAAELLAGYNWIQLPIAALQSLPAAAIVLPGGQAFAKVLVLPVLAIAFALLWGYLRRALQLDPVWTLCVVILLTLIGLAAQSIASNLAFALLQLVS